MGDAGTFSSAAITEVPLLAADQARKAQSSAQAAASASCGANRGDAAPCGISLALAACAGNEAGAGACAAALRGLGTPRWDARNQERSSVRAWVREIDSSVVVICFRTSSSASLHSKHVLKGNSGIMLCAIGLCGYTGD